jgi:hypothetical protein
VHGEGVRSALGRPIRKLRSGSGLTLKWIGTHSDPPDERSTPRILVQHDSIVSLRSGSDGSQLCGRTDFLSLIPNVYFGSNGQEALYPFDLRSGGAAPPPHHGEGWLELGNPVPQRFYPNVARGIQRKGHGKFNWLLLTKNWCSGDAGHGARWNCGGAWSTASNCRHPEVLRAPPILKTGHTWLREAPCHT